MHFIRDAVRLLDVGQARVNDCGTGSPRYPPTRMPGLLIDSYATGTFSSRQIERATYESGRFIIFAVKRNGFGSLRQSNGEDAKPTPETLGKRRLPNDGFHHGCGAANSSGWIKGAGRRRCAVF